MIKKLALATSNVGKRTEFSKLFEPYGIDLKIPSVDTMAAIEETGLTFIENALIKAQAVARAMQMPVIADDSGLIVDALHGEPGVRSARYAGLTSDAQRNNQKLLDAMTHVPDDKRSASFVCVLALVEHSHDPVPLIAMGRWDGEILREPRGTGGFGYDPLFYVPSQSCSAAELPAEVKNTLSHRAQASNRLFDQLRNNGLLSH